MMGCASLRGRADEYFARSSRSSNRTRPFAQRGYRVSRRRSILLVVGLIGGLALTIGGLALNFLFAFAGFVLVLVVAIMLETELRLLGRERLGQLPISAWLSGRRPSGVDDDATR